MALWPQEIADSKKRFTSIYFLCYTARCRRTIMHTSSLSNRAASTSYINLTKPYTELTSTNIKKHPKKVVSLYSSQDSKELYPGFTSSKVQSLQCHVAWGTRLLWSYPCTHNFLSRTPVANKGVKHKEPIKSPWKNMCKAPELQEVQFKRALLSKTCGQAALS